MSAEISRLEEQASDHGFWLEQGLFLARRAPDTGIDRALLSSWANGFLQQAGYLPPLGMVWDIAQVLLGEGYYDPPDVLPLSAAHRGVLQHYQDQVLLRLERDRTLIDLRDALAAQPERLRQQAVPLALQHLLRHTGFQQETAIPAGQLKKLLVRPIEALEQSAFEHHRDNPPLLERLMDVYRELTRCFLRSPALSDAGDVFVIRHYARLQQQHQRLAIEHVIAAAEALSAPLPRRLKPLTQRPPEALQTTLSDEHSIYPTGGFSGIANSGSFENLVTSELAYMDTDSRDIDLFDLRFCENELLFYTRDDSIHSRKSQAIVIALFPDLVSARFKDPGVGWQRLTLILALIQLCVTQLSDWLSDEGLSFELLLVRDRDNKKLLAEEAALLTLLLDPWIAKDRVTIRQPVWTDALTTLETEPVAQRRDLICFSSQRRKRRLPDGFQTHDVTLDGGWIEIADKHAPPRLGDQWGQWCSTTELLLRRLL
jgi:hypothetical protein